MSRPRKLTDKEVRAVRQWWQRRKEFQATIEPVKKWEQRTGLTRGAIYQIGRGEIYQDVQ